MYKGKKIMGLIPARGGSKGLIRKNVKELCGKPLVAWSIEHGLASKYVDRVIVSTDDQSIADISTRYGAEVPFLRPKELANDEAKTIDVIIHALDYFKEVGYVPDYLLLLEPTSPLREVSDIDNCIEALLDNNRAMSIVSVARLESGHPEFNIIIKNSTGLIKKLDGSTNFRDLRRQELKDVFFFEGTVYLSDVKSLYCKRTFYHESALACVVPRWKSLEIDELQDFICAEALLKARLEKKF